MSDRRLKRAPDVVEENCAWVISEWMRRVGNNAELMRVILSEDDRKDHVPGLLDEVMARSRRHPVGPEREKAAYDHGVCRYQQGYSVAMLVLECRLLQHTICECIERDRESVDLETVVTDMAKMWDTVALELEQSIRAYMSQLRAPE